MTLRRLTQGVNQNSLYRRAPFSLSQPYGKCLSGTPAGPLRRLGTGPADGRIMLPPPIFNMYCCGWQCTRPDWDLAGESVISLSETPPSAAHCTFLRKPGTYISSSPVTQCNTKWPCINNATEILASDKHIYTPMNICSHTVFGFLTFSCEISFFLWAEVSLSSFSWGSCLKRSERMRESNNTEEII